MQKTLDVQYYTTKMKSLNDKSAKGAADPVFVEKKQRNQEKCVAEKTKGFPCSPFTFCPLGRRRRYELATRSLDETTAAALSLIGNFEETRRKLLAALVESCAPLIPPPPPPRMRLRRIRCRRD